MKTLNKGVLLTLAAATTMVLSACGTDTGNAQTETASFKLVGSASATASINLMEDIQNVEEVLSTGAGSPTSVKLNLFALYLSTNADCSNPVLVQDYGTTAQTFDFYQSPTLFSGSPADGTYNCMILKATDQMSILADETAAAAIGGCSSTEPFVRDLYRDGGSDDGTWKDLEGNTVDATGSHASPGIDTMYTFITTDESAARGSSIAPHENQVILLSSALTVPGTTTYYADFTNGVGGTDTECDIVGGSTGFR